MHAPAASIPAISAPREVAPSPKGEDLLTHLRKTVLYADIFQYPLSTSEAYRYFLGCPTSEAEVQEAAERAVAHGLLELREGFYSLPGHEELAPLRWQRGHHAQALWPRARWLAALVAAVPFVRMVAVTGSLAMDNVADKDDIDLFIITAPGRLWLARGFVVLLARIVRLWGVELCPNYLIGSDGLRLPQQNLYTAHELAQMVPLYGHHWYLRLWQANLWLGRYLPNATTRRTAEVRVHPFLRFIKRVGELALRGPLGRALEAWERKRKIRRLQQRAGEEGGNVAFSPQECRGHFGGRETRVLATFFQRAAQVGPKEHSSAGAPTPPDRAPNRKEHNGR